MAELIKQTRDGDYLISVYREVTKTSEDYYEVKTYAPIEIAPEPEPPTYEETNKPPFDTLTLIQNDLAAIKKALGISSDVKEG